MSKFSKVLNLDEATRVDVASSTVTYIGKAIQVEATKVLEEIKKEAEVARKLEVLKFIA